MATKIGTERRRLSGLCVSLHIFTFQALAVCSERLRNNLAPSASTNQCLQEEQRSATGHNSAQGQRCARMWTSMYTVYSESSTLLRKKEIQRQDQQVGKRTHSQLKCHLPILIQDISRLRRQAILRSTNGLSLQQGNCCDKTAVKALAAQLPSSPCACSLRV